MRWQSTSEEGPKLTPQTIQRLTGTPEKQLRRTVKIFRPYKHAMQSGTDFSKHWRIEFVENDYWNNALMGWNSSSDPLTSMTLKFDTEDEAKAYCKKMGFNYEFNEFKPREQEEKNYGDNFKYVGTERISDPKDPFL
eukprot:CAMPEP_0114612418 /NCGR_PEP_ID=MMETSP0168-20121206/4611_1 /TAXON_ID=95228 ORGANISM="Vannella sp., Strain DIVA3 517/6/12" /NCGR_SAMPLE_ID=MMETSP0168 /ASSEMBLY_ACC=CAM_ASM_000044 /LENGTH=136 /DNA_ID=CAMNT_0001823401 /DNA_START=102 /DNA_END=512 /DNA_ORIENTATION=-